MRGEKSKNRRLASTPTVRTKAHELKSDAESPVELEQRQEHETNKNPAEQLVRSEARCKGERRMMLRPPAFFSPAADLKHVVFLGFLGFKLWQQAKDALGVLASLCKQEQQSAHHPKVSRGRKCGRGERAVMMALRQGARKREREKSDCDSIFTSSGLYLAMK